MWSFTDLAKKAAEAAEHAAEQAQEAAASSGLSTAFNLDAMQNQHDERTASTTAHQPPPTTSEQVISTPPRVTTTPSFQSIPTPVKTPIRSSHGKLKLPPKSSPTPKKSPLTPTKPSLASSPVKAVSPKPPTAPTLAAVPPSTVAAPPPPAAATPPSTKEPIAESPPDDDELDEGGRDGWDDVDVDDLDLSEQEKKLPESSSNEQPSTEEATATIADEKTPETGTAESVAEGERDESSSAPERQPETVAVEDTTPTPDTAQADDKDVVSSTGVVEPETSAIPTTDQETSPLPPPDDSDTTAEATKGAQQECSGDTDGLPESKAEEVGETDKVEAHDIQQPSTSQQQADGGEKEVHGTSTEGSVAPADEKDTTMDTAASETLVEDSSSSTQAVEQPASDSSKVDSPPLTAAVPDDVLEHFSHQMQRLEQNHQAERLEMEREHARQLEETLATFNHDACEQSRRELEERLETQLREKDEQIDDLRRRNEGQRLKIDVLQREVTGTQQLLSERDNDMGAASEAHGRDLKSYEEKLRISQEQSAKANAEIERLNKALEASKIDFARSKESHTALKERVKVVAEELKERRGECRRYHTTVEELTEANERLTATVEDLELRLSRQGQSHTDTNVEMEELRAKLASAESAIDATKKATEEKVAAVEKNLADYKKKAQNSLALANSRTASAVQAKEEAELEARAARTTADTAMDRAVQAELSSKSALAEAKAYVHDMEKEKNHAVEELESKQNALVATEQELASVRVQLQDAERSSEEGRNELKEKLKLEQAKSLELQETLLRSNDRVKTLEQSLVDLEKELHRANAAADAAKQSQSARDAIESDAAAAKNEKSSNDATIVMLQEELREANEAIEDLREALKTNGSDGGLGQSDVSNGTSTTPLFYAMSQQAQLNTARNEITRLANLLGAAQTDKMAALEEMELTKQAVLEAEAKLRRIQKSTDSSTSEYLKNIVLAFLNASHLDERKRLLTAICAVLEFTPEETAQALANADRAASLSGVTNSIFDNISGWSSK